MTSSLRPRSVAELRARNDAIGVDELFAQTRAFRPQPTDVMIATYPKCGTTWMQQIVHGLRTCGSMDFDEISMVVPYMEGAAMLDMELDAPQVARPRAFKTHGTWAQVPRGGRYIYVMRDPGDALVSLYHFMSGVSFEAGSIPIDSFAQEFYIPGNSSWGSYWAHLRSWWSARGQAELLFVCFEHMRQDLAGVVRQVARFIGVDDDQQRCEIATRQASYAFMRQHVGQFDDHPIQARLEARLNLPAGEPLAKVRSGQVGGSQRELSADTRAILEQTWQREIAAPLGVDSYAQLRDQVARLDPPSPGLNEGD